MNSTPINPATNGEGFTLAAQGRAKKRVQDERGSTLVEVVIAGTILAIALSGLYTLLGATVNEVKRGHTASGAQQNTVTRLDQIRSLTWASITDPDAVRDLLNDPSERVSSDTSSSISREVVTVSPVAVPQSSPLPSPTPSPTPTPGPGFSVIKIGDSVNISPSPYPHPNTEKLVNITVTTEWSTAGVNHQRQLSTLFSRAGSTAPKPVPSASPSATP